MAYGRAEPEHRMLQVKDSGRGVERVAANAHVIIYDEQGAPPAGVAAGQLVQLGRRNGVFRVAVKAARLLVLERVR